MIAAALTLLFAASAVFAVAVIAASLRGFGRQALALHGALDNAPAVRTFTYRIVTHETPQRPGARVVEFPARRAGGATRPSCGLRAAA